MPEPTTTPNPFHMFVGVLYDLLANITGTVGLTPLQLLGVIGAFLLIALVVTWARAQFTDQGWSLDDEADNGGPGLGARDDSAAAGVRDGKRTEVAA